MPRSLEQLKQTIRKALATLELSELQTQAELGYISDYILNLPTSAHWLDPQQEIPEALCLKVETLLNKRIKDRVPIQYLVSAASFYGLSYYVDPNVLIPRPETEHLVDLALAMTKQNHYQTALDLGTGSGIIPISLAYHLKKPDFQLTGVDISMGALAIAKKNAQTHDVEANIEWLQGDLFQPLAQQTFDMILSNPPYISHDEAETLFPEVYNNEPHLALFTPEGFPTFYQRIAQEASAHLNPGGAILVELGDQCTDHAQKAFTQAGFSKISVHPDYAGVERILVIQQ